MTTPPQQIDSLVDEQILARDVSFEEYLEYFAADFAELVDGVVIKMSPVMVSHNELLAFLFDLLRYFLRQTNGGRVFIAPVVMRLKPKKAREPDIQVLLPENTAKVKKSFVDGAADLVVEIVSEESRDRDTVTKLAEYEGAGVKEYWIFDQEKETPLFYGLDEQGKLILHTPDEQGVYHSIVLPGLKLQLEWLWQDPLPDMVEVIRLVDAMLLKTE